MLDLSVQVAWAGAVVTVAFIIATCVLLVEFVLPLMKLRSERLAKRQGQEQERWMYEQGQLDRGQASPDELAVRRAEAEAKRQEARAKESASELEREQMRRQRF